MFKTSPDMSEAAHYEVDNLVRGRNVNYPDVPVAASDSAQTRGLPLDMDTIRQFSFGHLDRSTPSQRPSTSGGPANTVDFAARRDAWRQETRDDLDFPLPSLTKQTIYYDFPAPGSLPTPDSCHSSPRDFLPLRKDSLAPSSIADSESESIIDVNMSALQMEIGMAIGSPTQAPAAWQAQGYPHAYNPLPEPMGMPMDGRDALPTPKHKSKWKVFGGLFGGRKQSPQTQNFYQLRSDRTPTEDVHHTPTRGWTVSEQPNKQKPGVQRSQTAPKRFNMQQIRDDNPEIFIDESRVKEDVAQPRTPGGGLLNIDIPDVHMERYSVMFGSLLGNPSESTPSLLMRRQATLERLKVVNEELALKEKELEEKEKMIKQPRRATSPQPTRSPAFSLFPNTPSRETASGRARSPNGRLVRSNTSPAALSPSRPSFAPGFENETHANLMEPVTFTAEPETRIEVRSESRASNYERPTSAMPKPLILKKPDMKSVVKLAQAQASANLQTTSPHSHPLRSFTSDSALRNRTEEIDIYDAFPRAATHAVLEPVAFTKPERQPSVSGSRTSQSEHSNTPSASSISTADSAALSVPPRASSRSASPQPLSVAKQIPLPISKFTAPPQAHKTRGRSQTTSSPSAQRSNLPRLSSRPRVAGPTEISGPTNLLASPLPVTPSPKSFPSPQQQQQQNKAEVVEDEDEERLSRLADVSIARQISVSRQQRQLLVPIKGSFKGKSALKVDESSTNSAIPNHSPKTRPTRPTIRTRASTVSASSPGNRVHDQNFPSPVQNFQSQGINVSHLTSPLSAVEKAATELSPSSSSSNLPKLSVPKNERKEMLLGGRKASTPTLVVISGSRRAQDDVESWEGAVINPKKDINIAERRRKARAEKLGGGAMGEGERRGHEHKKSEKVIVERM